MFAYAHEKHIPFILSAGDQYDSAEFKSTELLTRLFAIVNRYPEVAFIAVTGNHDPLTPASIYSRVEPHLYPEQFRLIRGEETVEMTEPACTVYAASPAEKRGRVNPLAWVPANRNAAAHAVRIGLGHGSLMIPGKFEEDDFPIGPGFVEEKNLDYLALGHWHSFYQAGERTCYPGAPQPMKFGEQGAVLDITIEGPGAVPHIQKAPITPAYAWEKKELIIDDKNYQTTLETVSSQKNNTIGEITLRGLLSPAAYRDLRQRVELLPASWFSLTVDNQTRIKPSPDEIPSAKEIGYLRGVIDTLLQDGEVQDAVKNRALEKLFLFLFEKELL